MNRQLDPTTDRLQRTLRAVAAQVVDVPPALVPLATAPPLQRRRKRALLVAAACLVVLVIGAVAFALTRRSQVHSPVIQQPSESTTTPPPSPPSLQHLVPGPAGTITRIDLQDASSLPVQPREYQLGYAGTVDGHAAQLMITADDFSHTQAPNFSLENHGCDTNGDGSPRFPGSIVPIGDHQACLITNIQNALHLGWIEADGVSILLQSSGLSVDQLEAIGASVQRIPGDALALHLRAAPATGLNLVGQGMRPVDDSTMIEFDQDGCSYVVTTRRADPVPFGFNPYSVPTTVRGASGQIIGVGTITWTSNDATMTIGLRAQDVLQVAGRCDSAGVAESLLPLDDAAWQQLLTAHPDLVHRNGS